MSSTIRMARLSPTEIRTRILEEHRRLRGSLVALQELARAVADSQAGATELRTSLRSLLFEFGLHLDSEDELLMPIVEGVDAWGPVRAEHMRAEHREQRAMLRDMFEIAETSAAVPLATRVDALVLRIFHDMREEELQLLRSDLFRDDPVSIDQMCG